MDKRTIQMHQHRKSVFCSLNSLQALSTALKTDKRRLNIMAERPQYKSFSVPKRGGGERHIEAPMTQLKQVLHRLNSYLQSVYFFEKSRAAYGFIPGVRNDDDRRNVVTNAKKHTGRAHLLNMDLQDFFHSVTKEQVEEIFGGKPFKFRKPVRELLAGLTTYNNRLPMGTSTSPVLSNFACRQMDEELLAFSEAMLWVYTRYADDMSFSSRRPFEPEKIDSIRGIIRKYGFTINEKKTTLYGPDDEKVVTGLLVTNKVDLAPGYLQLVESEIGQLKSIMQSQNEQGQLSTRWVEQFKQQVRGRLSFAGFVLKSHNEEYRTLKDAYYTAINPPEEDFGAINWRGFPYNF